MQNEHQVTHRKCKQSHYEMDSNHYVSTDRYLAKINVEMISTPFPSMKFCVMTVNIRHKRAAANWKDLLLLIGPRNWL